MASSVHGVEQSSGVSGGSTPIDLINMLDNDCLKIIFLNLPPGDKLNVEKVCKRWRAVSKISWSNVQRLNLTKSTIGETDYDQLPDIHKNIQSMMKILRRCGRYLRVLKLGRPCHYTVIPFALEHCENLVTLNISLYPAECDMSSISEITSLKSFSLEQMTNRSDSAIFRVLPRETLRGFHLRASEYAYDIDTGERLNLPNNYENYLRNVNNLVSIKLHHFHLDHAMEEIISRNINLDFLSLSNCMINGPFFLTALRNLKILDLENVSSIHNIFLDQLSRTCYRLTNLNLKYCHRVDDYGVMYLWQLPELEILNLDHMGRITDVSLIGFYNLRLLSCRNCRGIKDAEVITLIRIAHNLKTFDLRGTSITHKVLIEANEITKRRVDDVPLRIYVDTSVIANWVVNKDSPLLIVQSTDDVANPRGSRGERVCGEDDVQYEADYQFQYEYGSDSEPDDCGDDGSGHATTTETGTSDSDQ
ncbi:uncharacterized protein LOC107036195 [Diachasma alloeum]|uniref:uncharacterized protein LOC107036195 n=1 Tax=Diachasma alloeum TaxID=454923 RepID=UPI0007381C6D|nr:uncharacterized protein LOC107036195 [Diachasma alloeum]